MYIYIYMLKHVLNMTSPFSTSIFFCSSPWGSHFARERRLWNEASCGNGSQGPWKDRFGWFITRQYVYIYIFNVYIYIIYIMYIYIYIIYIYI